MNRKLAVRIAAILLVLHGLIEILGLVFRSSMATNTVISFGGLTGPLLAKNAGAVAIFGGLWGVSRFIAAWGMWSLRKWAMALGLSLCLVTIVAAITIIPAGLADTFLALPALMLLLYAWFGSEVKEIQ